MAIPNPLLLLSALLLLLLPTAAAMSEADLDAAISFLRFHGYSLFPNSITVSDVLFDLLLPNASFTLFAPADPDLRSLGMSSTALLYTRSLRHHVALGRLNATDLVHGGALPTLLQDRSLRVSRRFSSRVSVSGVDVVDPGIYEGKEVIVHGLAGLVALRPSSADMIPCLPGSAGLRTPEGSPVPTMASLLPIAAMDTGAAAVPRSEDSVRFTGPNLWIPADVVAPPECFVAARDGSGSCSAAAAVGDGL